MTADKDAIGRAVDADLERPQPGLAWQRFLPSGPLAFLPLSDGRAKRVAHQRRARKAVRCQQFGDDETEFQACETGAWTDMDAGTVQQVVVGLSENSGAVVSGGGSVAVVQFEVIGAKGGSQLNLSRLSASGANATQLTGNAPPPVIINTVAQ